MPVLSVKIMYNGAYVEMNRVSDNYFNAFAAGGLAFNLPTSLQITSVLGDTVFDTLAVSTPSVSLAEASFWPQVISGCQAFLFAHLNHATSEPLHSQLQISSSRLSAYWNTALSEVNNQGH